MTVGELIEKLQKFDPSCKAISFHEDLRTVTHQMQQIHSADYIHIGGFKWVVIQAQGLTYDDVKPEGAVEE